MIKNSIKFLLNPVVNILKITTSTNAKSVIIYDLSDKLILNQLAKTSNNDVNLLKLKTETHPITIETEARKETIKVIKK